MPFHPIIEVLRDEARKDNTRTFIGDGNHVLRVPGLKKLESVVCTSEGGQIELPLVERREFPTDLSMKRLEAREEPVIRLERLPDGCPILLRNQTSNFGFWQAGHEFHVSGDWDAAVPAPAFDPPKKAEIPRGKR